MQPQGSCFLSARWMRLAILNYQVDPAILSARVPAGTELDAWHGRTFVSMVGFQFLDTRVLGWPVPFHRDFLEVNLRFYVKRTVDDEVRRGVVFVKEIVPRYAVAWLANALYGERYVALPMSCRDEAETVRYSWQFGGKPCHLSTSTAGDPYVPDPESEASFIIEHYWGYVARRDGSTLEYRVDHAPWRVQHGTTAVLECDVAALYGSDFAPSLNGGPSSAFLAEGSAVRVGRGVRVVG
jgi:uncharacterized protein YqjF (DUF2071 family)